MFDGSFRASFDRIVAPIAKVLEKLSINPNFLTIFGVIFAFSTAYFLSFGSFKLALLMLALTGLADALDGAVAKVSGTASIRGAYLDSVFDRVSDGLIFFGLGWFYLDQESELTALLPFALYFATSLISYQRAKAESLGFSAKGGIMERAERFIMLGFGFFFDKYLVAILWVMLFLILFTVVTRFFMVWKQASQVDLEKNPNSATGSKFKKIADANNQE